MSDGLIYLPTYERYLDGRRLGYLAAARRIDAIVKDTRPSAAIVGWITESKAAYRAGESLALFDREMRRAAVLSRAERAPRAEPRPLPLRQGRLEIARATEGSLELVLVGVGLLGQVLLSDPVQLVLTAEALLGHAVRARAWLRRRGDPLGHTTAREAFLAVEEYLRLDDLSRGLGQPDATASWERERRTPQEARDELVDTVGRSAPADARITLPDGTELIGDRVAVMTFSNDGTRNIIVAERLRKRTRRKP